jgi:hypothetical protein
VLIDKPSWQMPGGFCISGALFVASPCRGGTPKKETHMSQEAPREHISKKRVVYTMPGMNDVRVRRNHEYRITESGTLTMDLYYPPDAGTRTPAVVFVTGFSDVGARTMLGCTLKEMGSYISWGELVAASGLVGVTYANRDPATDVHAILDYVRQHAASLNLDESNIALWACSGNAPTAVSLLMQDAKQSVKCGVLCYPYTLDLDGSTVVADAARQWGFVNPSAGKSVDDLRHDIPIFIARAGQDEMPGLNEALDRFLAGALARNLPITFVNHAMGPHAFDLWHDSETTRGCIRQILGFLRLNLLECVSRP